MSKKTITKRPSKKRPLYEFDKKIYQESGIIVGVDEAGRGPLAGPVVAAAVCLDLENPIDGIDDSKKLTAEKRELLYNEIVTKSKGWAVADVSNQEIDSLNILQATFVAMKRALNQLDLAWDLVLVDGNHCIRGLDSARQKAVIGGDALSASIAAASIIAKVTRDRIMEQYATEYPHYEFSRHKGYATELHRERLMEHGLSAIHRRTFCTAFLCQQTTLPL